MDTIRRLEWKDVFDTVRGYLFRYHKAGDDRIRPSAGSDNADIHAENSRAVISTVYGNTVKWNQLMQNGNFVNKSGWNGSFDVNNNIASRLPNSTYSYINRLVPVEIGHTYILSVDTKTENTTQTDICGYTDNITVLFGASSNSWSTSSIKITASTSSLQIYILRQGMSTTYQTLYAKNVMLFDLTAIFGSGNEPSVAAFENWLSLTVGAQDYYPYDAGSLISFGGTAVKSVGFNQWTGATAKVLSGQEYYIGGTYTSLSYSDGTSIVPTNRLFTANKTDNVTITGGSTDTVLNLSCDKNGTYAPYWEDVVDLSFVPNIGFETFNIWDETHYLANSVLNQDGNNVNTSSGNFTIGTFDNKIPVLPNKDYNITLNNAVVGYKYACFFDDNGNNISRREGFNNIPIHTPNNAAYMLCSIGGYSSDIYTYNICINESVAGLNGMYLPYGTPYYLFPDGQLKSAGSVSDEVSATTAIKRVGDVDLGDLTWETTSYSNVYKVSNLPFKTYTSLRTPIICSSSRYSQTTNGVSTMDDKTILTRNDGILFIKDTAYTDAATFKTAMSGVMLYYELATPITISHNNHMNYKVDKYSTEELIVPTSVSGQPTSSAINADIDYQYRG